MKGCLGKFLVITFLSLLCLIPLAMVDDVVDERGSLHYQLGEEIAAQHGGYQKLAPPLLIASCVVQETKKRLVTDKVTNKLTEEEFITEQVVFVSATPKSTAIKGVLQPKKLYRGIYSLPVYDAQMLITGSFDGGDLPRKGDTIDGHTVTEIPSVRLFVPVKNPRGIASHPIIAWGGSELDVEPGMGSDGVDTGSDGFSAVVAEGSQVSEISAGSMPFTVGLDFQGSHTLNFFPGGGEFSVDLESTWPHPEFQGEYLPTSREVTSAGFTARWSVTEFSHAPDNESDSMVSWNQPFFSVELIEPVDIYLQSTRAVKYGILFILLTFESFLLFEMLRGLRIHPIQYVLVGGALTLFYLLLVSLSEHIGFALAYLTASIACTSVLSAYVRSVAREMKVALGFGACMTILYGALYIILLSEQYALALGTGLLFFILVATMYLTRNVDWYALEVDVDYKRLFRREKGKNNQNE